jgi:adenylosuccinate synthase
MGIWETVVRSKTEFGLKVSELGNFGDLKEKVLAIRDEWGPRRMKELGLTKEPVFWEDVRLLNHFLDDCAVFRLNVHIGPWAKMVELPWNHVVFEGAQGLRLDMDGEDSPHVSASKTGLPNVVELLTAVNYKGLVEVYYVTRPYLTRHGAGPLRNEISDFSGFYPNFQDDTNIFNSWQRDLRFARHDIYQFSRHIQNDLKTGLIDQVRPHLAFTCLDHVEGRPVHWTRGAEEHFATGKQFIAPFCEAAGIPLMNSLFVSGPTRSHVEYPRCLPRWQT